MTDVKLACGQCGYNNEPERVYCHNCGSKLDRSLMPKTEDSKKQETAESTRKRVVKMTNPKSTSIAREVKTLASVLAGAAVCAALFLFSQKPDDVPDAKQDIPDRRVQDDLSDVLQSSRPASVAFSDAEANAYLGRAVKSTAGLVPGIEFRRLYVNFIGGNVLRVGAEQSLWGYPVYSGMKFRVSNDGGKFAASCVGGNFGRLSVPQTVMPYADFAFQKLWTALKRDRDHVAAMQSVTVEKGRIVLVSAGAPR